MFALLQFCLLWETRADVALLRCRLSFPLESSCVLPVLRSVLLPHLETALLSALPLFASALPDVQRSDASELFAETLSASAPRELLVDSLVVFVVMSAVFASSFADCVDADARAAEV